jgi:hypothetical protein
MKPLKGFLHLLILSLSVIIVFLPAAVFIHEATHFLLYQIEGIPVTSFHVLDFASFEQGFLGFVTTTKQSLYERGVHEGIANLVGYSFVTAILLFFLLGPLRTFTIRQLESMGLKRNNTHHLKKDVY